MLNNNFKNYFVAQAGGSSIRQTLVATDGAEVSTRLGSLTNYFSCKSLKIEDFSSSVGCTFILGTGTTTPTAADYTLANRVDDSTNFAISSAQTINSTGSGFQVQEQVWVYTNAESPTTEVTINEIGLVLYDTTAAKGFMVAREVLESPITVKDGDVFSVSMRIG